MEAEAAGCRSREDLPFGVLSDRALRSPVTLVLGANKDGVLFEKREIRLIKWDRYLFAPGSRGVGV
jgi:hypothetical protein